MADDKPYPTKPANGHIRSQDLQIILEGGGQRRLDLLEHIGACGHCSAELADAVEKKGLLPPPPSFKEEVLLKSKALRTQTERILYETSARMQLFLYSLRVGCAVLGALVLLFLGGTVLSLQPENGSDASVLYEYDERTSEPEARAQEKPSLSLRLSESSNRVNQALQNFSDRLIRSGQFFDSDQSNYMEVLDNDE